ncbi:MULTISPECIES: hypothetical protein [Burkholderia]|uniref:Lipoprotein n=1 Tax=Burkholderia aenigmatica TaxID=2015348 RepID=A0A6J5IQK2_9BURK|nr:MULTISPECIES: hypothetical protein [Burkholderia]CAB3962025.1 hypothetical protein BLA3211_01512 [Burkholderia aenigmatica]
MKKVLQRTVTLRTALGAAAAGLVLSACGSTQMNMIDVQASTVKTLGLASSDEITVANVQYGKKDGLDGQKVSYDATTGKGRRFGCTVFMIPGLTPIDRPTYNNWECHPQR